MEGGSFTRLSFLLTLLMYFNYVDANGIYMLYNIDVFMNGSTMHGVIRMDLSYDHNSFKCGDSVA